MQPKYPNITVKLVGSDGNAWAVLGKMTGALRKAGIDQAEIKAFVEEAVGGDYDHLLRTCMEWVDVE